MVLGADVNCSSSFGQIWHYDSPPCVEQVLSVQTEMCVFRDAGKLSQNDCPETPSKYCIHVSPQLHVKCVKQSCVDLMAAYSQDQDGDTALHVAIILGETEFALHLISKAPNSDVLDIQNSLLQTPLHLAVITNQVDIVRRLMTAGVRLCVRDHRGNTPLHLGCKERFEDVVESLLTPIRFEETSCNKYKPEYDQIPQDLAVRNGDGLACLHLAAMTASFSNIDALLTAGADINIRDGKSGRTILHYAAETGDSSLMLFLLPWRQLNVNAMTYAGLSPLDVATGRGYESISNILKENGAEIPDQESVPESETAGEGDDYT